jgi:hypothetical protein
MSSAHFLDAMVRRTFLVCGILSSLLYVAMTVLVATQWDEYSSLSYTISELSAIGAPTRSVWVLPGAVYTVLVTLFGCGVMMSAGGNRRLRAVGILVALYGSLGLVWPFAPMHQREVLAAGGGTMSDTLHVLLAAVTVTLMLAAMVVGIGAAGARFRVYSVVSLAILAVFALLTFRDAPRLSANLPTPWIGVWERINVGVFLLWVVVLACVSFQRLERAAAIARRSAPHGSSTAVVGASNTIVDQRSGVHGAHLGIPE